MTSFILAVGFVTSLGALGIAIAIGAAAARRFRS